MPTFKNTSSRTVTVMIPHTGNTVSFGPYETKPVPCYLDNADLQLISDVPLWSPTKGFHDDYTGGDATYEVPADAGMIRVFNQTNQTIYLYNFDKFLGGEPIPVFPRTIEVLPDIFKRIRQIQLTGPEPGSIDAGKVTVVISEGFLK
jgi:hypothetical protein